MTTDEKIRSLINQRLREVHSTIQGVLSMGDLAVYVGQPMQDAMTELAEFVKEADQELIRKLTDALTKLANEASGFRCLADISRHGATNMKVLGDRVTEAFEVLAEAKERAK